MKRLIAAAIAFAVLAALYSSNLYNYLLFHTLAEVFAVIIACGIFMVAWNSRRFFKNDYLLFIGIAYLFIGILDLAHMFAYKGMNVLPDHGANTPTQLWIAARYLESLTLLAAPLLFFRRIRPGLQLLGFGALTALLLLSIFYWRIFPDCFLEEAGGLTPFKKTSEYIICLILLVAGALILRFRDRFDPGVLRWVTASIILTVIAELAFTTYASVYGPANMLGHILKIGSFFCMYKAIIETGLARPYELLFRDLKQSEENQRRQREWLRVILSSIGDAVIATDTAGRIAFINPVAGALTGWQPEEAEGRSFSDIFNIIDEISRLPGEDIVAKVLGQGKTFHLANHTSLISRDGREIPIEDSAAPIRDTQGAIIGAVLVFHDVTERRRNQATLARSADRFKLLSHTAGRLLATDDPQALVYDLCLSVMAHLDCQTFVNFLVDESDGRLSLNACAGISAEEVHLPLWPIDGKEVCCGAAGTDERPIVDEALATCDLRANLMHSHGIQACSCHSLMVGNRMIGTLSFGTRNRPQYLPEEIDLMRIVANQVTQAIERVQSQNYLRHVNDALESKVKDRTATLANMVGTLQEENVLRRQAEDKLKRANKELGTRARQLRELASELTMAEHRERKRLSQVLHDGLQQYLAIAKLQLSSLTNRLTDESIKKTIRDIEVFIGESIQISRSLSAELSPPVLYEGGLPAGMEWLARWMRDKHEFSIDLEMEPIEDLPEDVKVLVFESVRELLFNTVKHANVTWARVSLQPVESGGIQITVSDQGSGFDAKHVKSGGGYGGGFGLLSIRERIDLIGGTFEIDSTPGQGSRFILRVPRVRHIAQVAPSEKDAPVNIWNVQHISPQKSTTTLRVLIVDDHSLFRDGVARLVNREADIEVVGQARDGLEAIELAGKLLPDVILMDISMPGLNGIEATRRIHQTWPQIHIIGLSMHEDQDHAKAMCAAGAVGYKNKGCQASELVDAIRVCAGTGLEPN